MSTEQAKIINQSITRLLARREHSYHELIQKLTQRDFSLALCEQQLTKFAKNNIQSDQRFAESFVRNAYSKGKGPQFIRQRLVQHQINDSFIHALLSQDEFDWFTLAIEVRVKKFGQSLPLEYPQKQKQMRFLQYRGFETVQIMAAFD